MGQGNAIEVHTPLPERYRRQASEVLYAAFRRKFEPILGTPGHGIAILEQNLEPGLTIVALSQDQLAGAVGLEYNGHYFFEYQMRAFAHEYGWLSGLLRYALFLPFARHHREGELTVGAIAVRPTMQGKGVGTRLLQAVFEHALANGFGSVCLEVVDTNPAARRLYERLGFRASRTRQYPFLRRAVGFSAATMMIKTIVWNTGLSESRKEKL